MKKTYEQIYTIMKTIKYNTQFYIKLMKKYTQIYKKIQNVRRLSPSNQRPTGQPLGGYYPPGPGGYLVAVSLHLSTHRIATNV